MSLLKSASFWRQIFQTIPPKLTTNGRSAWGISTAAAERRNLHLWVVFLFRASSLEYHERNGGELAIDWSKRLVKVWNNGSLLRLFRLYPSPQSLESAVCAQFGEHFRDFNNIPGKPATQTPMLSDNTGCPLRSVCDAGMLSRTVWITAGAVEQTRGQICY